MWQKLDACEISYTHDRHHSFKSSKWYILGAAYFSPINPKTILKSFWIKKIYRIKKINVVLFTIFSFQQKFDIVGVHQLVPFIVWLQES